MRRLYRLASALPLALLAACGGSSRQSAPPPAVDLLRQAQPASEIVEPAQLQRHVQELLAAKDPRLYLAGELQRLGLVPGGAKGGWEQPFENRRRVARSSAWVLARGDGRATLGTNDVVAALGGRAAGVRLRGLQAVFVAPTLAVRAGALASKVVVVLAPVAAPLSSAPVTPMSGVAAAATPPPAAPSPLPDLLRRAAAAGAHAVVVLPRPGVPSVLPTPSRAAELAAGSGVPVVAWLDDTAAQALLHIGLDVSLEAMPRLEWRLDLQPLALGTVHAEVRTEVDRERHRNIVALLPGRGESTEAVAVIATLPGSTPRAAAAAGEPDAGAPVADTRTEAAAAVELLAVATAFQALSDPPRRTVVFALTDPGSDGLAGARQLLADPRLQPPRLAAALVLAAANLGPPTQDVSFVGARASPLYGMTARLAALQGRRIVGDTAPQLGRIWHSPAWALLQARVPVALFEPGVVARPGPSFPEAGAVVPVADVGAQPFAGMLEDARLAFRVALELAEGGRPPRVDPAKVETVLRQPVFVAPPVMIPARPRSRQIAAAAPDIEGGAGVSLPTTGGEPAAAQPPGPRPPGLSSVPEFVAPPPSGTAPPEPMASPPSPPQNERLSQPAPTATPPQRRG
ncbi:MAG TPA: hypothetical protein VGS57_13260 [Thermoanaerobaculia bacterium]|nr:hypothetical protein [Thermoanaerobaculia bacterium]